MRRKRLLTRKADESRRGSAAPLVAVTMPVLVAFTALTVDYGYVVLGKSQLQNVADAAALAGASAYFSDSGMRRSNDELTLLARARAKAMAHSNEVMTSDMVLADADVTLGQHNFGNWSGPLSGSSPWNAVHITARRTQGSPNGPLSLFFARIFGVTTANVAAHARAAANDRVAGYRLYKDGIFAPFTIHVDRYNEMLANGPDGYSYQSESGDVWHWGDGVREIVLYPWKWDTLPEKNYDGTDSEGSGNFGTLTVGLGSQGTSFLEAQILDGITTQELIDCFGTDELIFYDDQHTAETGPRTYQAPGNPGLSAGMRDAVEARIGDVIGYFINNGVVMNGSNASYSICGIAFGRIMDIRLTGGKHHRHLTLQPVAYFDEWVRVDDSAPSTNGRLGHVSLVQ